MEGVDKSIDPIEEAREYILLQKQECALLGANDSEPGDLDRLMDQLLRKEITPDEAKRLAYEVYERKNPYH